MTNEYISSVAWGKNIKTKSQKKAEARQRRYKKLKAVGSAVKSSLGYMGKKVSKVAYKTGRSIREEQDSKGGFYNLSGRKPSIKSQKKIKKNIY